MTRIICLFLSVIWLTGCGDSATYQLAHVSGKVTLDGKPLPCAVVTFQPVAQDSEIVGPGSVAHCDDQGSFDLKTVRDEPGAVIGLHKVIIFPSQRERIDPAKIRDDVDDKQDGIPNVPARYNYETTLTFDVPQAGTDSADFALTSSP
jgi:hypothetical protein